MYFGITNTYKLNKRTKGYLITDGYYRGYDIYTKNKDGHTLYKLVYGYEVNEKQYTIATDYSINKNLLPEINSRRKIKYNPSNPSQAVVEGMNQSHFLIYFGIFFIISGSVFIFVFLSLKGLLDRFKFNILEV